MTAEGLFREVLKRQEKKHSYERLMALQFYAKMLHKYPARKTEAESKRGVMVELIEEAKELQQVLPRWHGLLLTLHQPGFKFGTA